MLEKSGAVFNIEDEVFYKQDDKRTWKGPGRVFGQDGPVVYIWHGLYYIRAHSCQVQLTNHNLDNTNLSQTSNAIPLVQTNTPPPLDIPKPQALTDTAIDTTNNDTDNEYETTTNEKAANEHRNDNISNEDKKENSTTEHRNGSIIYDKKIDLKFHSQTNKTNNTLQKLLVKLANLLANIAYVHSVHSPPLSAGGGWTSSQIFEKKGGLDKTSTLRGGLLKEREVTFFGRWDGELQFL